MRITLDAGGEGEASAFEGHVLRAILPRAFAPGAPVVFSVSLAGEARSLRGKSIGSKRREDGAFEVRMRMISLRREERAALEAALTP